MRRIPDLSPYGGPLLALALGLFLLELALPGSVSRWASLTWTVGLAAAAGFVCLSSSKRA